LPLVVSFSLCDNVCQWLCSRLVVFSRYPSLPQVTDKLYHIILYRVYLAWAVSGIWTCSVVILIDTEVLISPTIMQSRPRCNQCLSPLTFWVQIPLRRGVLDTTLCDKSLSVTCGRSIVFSRYTGLNTE
jgi:hypothetical protein